MLQTAPPRQSDRVESRTAYTLRGAFTSSGRTIPHLQYLTQSYVVTEFESTTILFSADLGGRFAVDRERERLRPMDDASRRGHVDHLRSVLGTVRVDRSNCLCELDGFRCRLFAISNDHGRISIDAEAWCAEVQGVEETALHQERQYDAELHPFHLPLASNEMVIRSLMRTSANGTRHEQTYQLLSMLHSIDRVEELDRFLDFAIADR